MYAICTILLYLEIHNTKISMSVLRVPERKRMISFIWNLYQNVDNTPATFTYVLKQGIYVLTFSRLWIYLINILLLYMTVATMLPSQDLPALTSLTRSHPIGIGHYTIQSWCPHISLVLLLWSDLQPLDSGAHWAPTMPSSTGHACEHGGSF